MVDEPVVLRVEDVVHGRQADVLVAASVTGDEVRREQFLVVRVGRVRDGVVGDVVEERDAGTHGLRGVDGSGGVALDRLRVRDDELGEAVRAWDEVAVGVRLQKGHLVDVHVVEGDAEHRRGLFLDVRPGREAVTDAVAVHVVTVHELAGVHRTTADHVVLADERLVGGLRGVGLVLVDEGGGPVDRVLDVVAVAGDAVRAGQIGRSAHHHEVGVAALDIELVVGLERHHDRPAAALAD